MKLKITLLVLACLALNCSNRVPRGENSVLIIAIANFRADDLGCGSAVGSLTPQLDAICEEAIRFTHAYTPSVLVNPALVSLLTGLYPFDHNVHRNGASRLTDSVITLPELARSLGRQAFIVSGGVPVLRKSAVSQGFEDFDDSIRTNGSYYRRASDVIQRFLSIAENRAAGNSFLGVIFISDLAFPEVLWEDESTGKHVEGTFNGKLIEIDEAIGRLHSEFKKARIWDSLTVVIAGLQGFAKTEHESLSKGINLYDEVVRVPLIFKPSRKPSESIQGWKVDRPVSLVDVGATLFDVMDPASEHKPIYPAVNILNSNSKDFDRPIFCESDLPLWKNWGPRLVSLRLGEWVYWPAPEPMLFNTYTDRLQLHNLFSKDFLAFSRIQKKMREFEPKVLPPATRSGYLPQSIGGKLRAARVIFSRTSSLSEKLSELKELEIRRPADWQVAQWQTQLLLDHQNWPLLNESLRQKKPSSDFEKRELKAWRALVDMKFKKIPVDLSFDRCLLFASNFKSLTGEQIETLQDHNLCADSETQYWIKSYLKFRLKKPKEAAALFESAKALTDKRVEQTEFSKLSWIDGATWDFPENLPEGPAELDLFTMVANDAGFLKYIKRKQAP